MKPFKEHKISVKQLLTVIPEALLSHLSLHTKVDYYSKVLHGKKMFYLLLYGLIENDRLSQRTLEDTFNDSIFKTLFSLDESEKIRRSSISERLSKIDADYFKQVYEFIYEQFSQYYTPADKLKYNLIRVDSTMVYEASGKIKEGFDYKNGKKAVKYSVAFDGLLPCFSKVFTDIQYASEDIALPEVVKGHIKQESEHENIYVIDRGLQSTRNMKAFSDKAVLFVLRAKENRKYQELESLISNKTSTDLGELILLKDSKVYFFTGKPINNKQGNIHHREELVEVPFRLIIAQSIDNPNNKYWFIANEFNLSAKEITDIYKRRWDIEIFFRFIKQELNASHFVSLNRNGIQVMLYMTLITAMLLLIYKHANNIGYKTAKRRFSMEVRNLAIELIIIQCGGDPSIYFKT